MRGGNAVAGSGGGAGGQEAERGGSETASGLWKWCLTTVVARGVEARGGAARQRPGASRCWSRMLGVPRYTTGSLDRFVLPVIAAN
ncbi:hypothetical protein E2C01_033828 [Portunus trituberculatus]|uniref:Uncharacterized protein n=1 Tax=Portunus trituberculatus TaxID=210409 RepID=A0A5B7F589_PORTR|nr:hypothetical protein [Portunus trituberculatus]